MTDHAPSDISPDKKIALITGASRGIGRATALQLAKKGYHIIALARTVGALEELDDLITAAGGTCTLVPQDLIQFDKVELLGPALLQKFGRLDLLVANAGVLGTLGPVAHTSPKDFEKVFKINVEANFRLIRTLDPLLKQSDAPQVVFLTTSDSVMDGRAYWGAYGASKAALQSLARTYEAENQQNNLQVHLFNPGATRTAMRAAAMPGEDPETLPTPEHVAGRLVELLLPTA